MIVAVTLRVTGVPQIPNDLEVGPTSSQPGAALSGESQEAQDGDFVFPRPFENRDAEIEITVAGSDHAMFHAGI
jgi:hypothetical protein